MKKAMDYGPEHQLNLKLIIGLSRTLTQINRGTQKLLAERGLTLPQFGVLEALYHLGSMRISELIEKTLSTSGNMTVVIRNLEQDGWVQRLQDAADKRAYLIDITDKGRDLISQLFPAHLNDLTQQMKRLDQQEKAQLFRLLKKLNGLDTDMDQDHVNLQE